MEHCAEKNSESSHTQALVTGQTCAQIRDGWHGWESLGSSDIFANLALDTQYNTVEREPDWVFHFPFYTLVSLGKAFNPFRFQSCLGALDHRKEALSTTFQFRGIDVTERFCSI